MFASSIFAFRPSWRCVKLSFHWWHRGVKASVQRQPNLTPGNHGQHAYLLYLNVEDANSIQVFELGKPPTKCPQMQMYSMCSLINLKTFKMNKKPLKNRKIPPLSASLSLSFFRKHWNVIGECFFFSFTWPCVDVQSVISAAHRATGGFLTSAQHVAVCTDPAGGWADQ